VLQTKFQVPTRCRGPDNCIPEHSSLVVRVIEPGEYCVAGLPTDDGRSCQMSAMIELRRAECALSAAALTISVSTPLIVASAAATSV